MREWHAVNGRAGVRRRGGVDREGVQDQHVAAKELLDERVAQLCRLAREQRFEIDPSLLPASQGAAHSSFHAHYLSRPDVASFELRVSVYQADGLLAADSNGFSDPFLRATIGGQSRRTTYKACTLAPRWYESLVF